MIPAVYCDARVCLFLISNEAVGIDSSLFGKRSVRLAVMESINHIYVAHSLSGLLVARLLVSKLHSLLKPLGSSLAFIVVR